MYLITTMNTRLKQFLSAENISQSQFADAIKVVRASVSHVLSGRNNPGYDFIKAIMLAYPNLNIEWLILGKGKMYKAGQDNSTLFNDIEENSFIQEAVLQDDPVNSSPINYDQPLASEENSSNLQTTASSRRNVKKVIIFFDDDTYQEM